jgi:hypothetical protein
MMNFPIPIWFYIVSLVIALPVTVVIVAARIIPGNCLGWPVRWFLCTILAILIITPAAAGVYYDAQWVRVHYERTGYLPWPDGPCGFALAEERYAKLHPSTPAPPASPR